MTMTYQPPRAGNFGLKITLEDVRPAVLRRVEVPTDIMLTDLHQVVQAAMPWTNSHLYAFKANGMAWGVQDPDYPDGVRITAKPDRDFDRSRTSTRRKPDSDPNEAGQQLDEAGHCRPSTCR